MPTKHSKLPSSSYVHPSAFIDYPVAIGENTKIWHHCHLREGVRVGKNCILGHNVYLDCNVQIGHQVKIQNNVSLFHGVTISNNVFIGPHVCFTNDLFPRSTDTHGRLLKDDEWEVKPTVVKEGASIGANSTILPGITIGKYAMIGAGSVVTKDAPQFSLMIGNPARQAGWVCKCGQKLSLNESKINCVKCYSNYYLKNNRLLENY